MPRASHTALEDLAAAVFGRLGAPDGHARQTARLLVEADLMGLPSHGVLRVMQYAADIRAGTIVPQAPPTLEPLTPTSLLVDANWNFGQVAADQAAQAVLERAREQGMAWAAVRRCRHVGRVGAYTEFLARGGAVGLAACSTAGEGRWVAPFGGRQGRLGTNPLSFAAPTGGDPLVLDFSTSSLPEGRVRYHRDTGMPLPPDTLVDADGRPSTRPQDLYAADGAPAGAITPFGGAQGYKGFGLGLMVQVLGCLIGRVAWDELGTDSHANTMWIMAIDLSRQGVDEFRAELDAMLAYIASSAPADGSDGVLLPGQREFEALRRHQRDGLPLALDVWNQLRDLAAALDINSEGVLL